MSKGEGLLAFHNEEGFSPRDGAKHSLRIPPCQPFSAPSHQEERYRLDLYQPCLPRYVLHACVHRGSVLAVPSGRVIQGARPQATGGGGTHRQER
jgi:hypothetical protein